MYHKAILKQSKSFLLRNSKIDEYYFFLFVYKENQKWQKDNFHYKIIKINIAKKIQWNKTQNDAIYTIAANKRYEVLQRQ